MSNHLVKAYNDGSGSSRASYSSQSCWMSRWSHTPSKQGSLVAPHSRTFSTEEGLDPRQKRLRRTLNIDVPRFYGIISAQNLGEERLDHEPFCFLGRSRNRENGMALRSPLDQGSSEYEKYSAILVQERNGFTPLLSENHCKDVHYDPNSEELPCSLRNVKAMRICATIDSVGDSDGGPPLFSQTTTHHFLVTKRTGVKIQPLWSSTDSEKDRSRDLSTETDTMDVVALSNENEFSGVILSPVVERTMRDKSHLTPSVDPREDKVRGKMPVTETPDTNSMNADMEPSTSRTQTMEADHLLSCPDQPSESEPTAQNKERSLPEPSSIWVKRLKLSSSVMGESSSHDKTHILQSSWIQRWCQDRAMASNRHSGQSFVVCEPDRSKLVVDELTKKQFPSIAAMALMGKSMNGFRPCKFTRHGPLVVWNAEDH